MSAEHRSSSFFLARWLFTNLRLRPARSFLTVLGVAISVALFVAIVSFHRGYRRSLQRSVDQLGFEVLVTAKGCPYEAATLFLRGGTIPMYLNESVQPAVSDHPAVRSSTRLFLQTVSSGDNRHHLVLGVDDAYRELKPWLEVQSGAWFHGLEGMEAVLGYNVAIDLSLSAGDRFRLPGVESELEVKGILERVGGQDDGTVFLPLRTAQRLFDQKDRITGIGVKVADVGLLPEYLTQVYELPGVQVVTLSQAQSVLLDLVGTARRLLLAVGGLAAVVAGLALTNTLLMASMERRRELAVLRALGARGRFLFLLLSCEAQLLALGGAVVGIALALLSSHLLEVLLRWLLPFAPEGRLMEIEAGSCLVAFGVSFAAGWICALYPALRSARLKPAQAIALE